MREFGVLFLLSFLALSGCSLPIKDSFEVGEDGSFRFDIQTFKAGDPEFGQGRLVLPEHKEGKVPLVVLVHGTAAIGYRENTWASFLSDQGFAVFLVDYFSPRGTSGQSSKVPRPPEDVWGALNILSRHPSIDISRTAVMGFSNGATVVNFSSAADPDFGDIKTHLPRGYIMLYGGCHFPLKTYDYSYRPPFLYIVGSKDNLVPADVCLQRENDLSGKNVRVVVIEGAGHMFDGNKNTTFIHPRWGRVTLAASGNATQRARDEVVFFLRDLFE